MTRDVDGSEILVQTNSADPTPIPNCQNGFVKIKLSTAQQTCLHQLDWSMSVHISAPDHGGWILAETNNNTAASSPWFAYTNELLQIKLDGTQVRRMGHHRSNSTVYAGQPRVSVSRDGRRFAFNSNMMGLTTDVYLATASEGSFAAPSVLTSISPMSAADHAFTLTARGTNFAPGASIVWNGALRPTTFVSSTELTALIPSSDLAIGGIAPVAVFNPLLGGGTSNALSFTVIKKRRGQVVGV
jgi:hypothetical protein